MLLHPSIAESGFAALGAATSDPVAALDLPDAVVMCSDLLQRFAKVSDGRSDQGRVHPVAVVLALCAAAVVAGMASFTAIAGWATDVPAELLARLYGRCAAPPFGGKLIGHNDPDHQEKVIKFNELIANCVIYSTALDITDAANELAAEGEPVDPDDLATIAPYITHTVHRFGNWVINLTPPDQPVTRLDLEPRVLFRAAPT